MGGGVRRVTLAVRVVAAMLLAASTLLWVSGSMVGAWSSNDGAVATFGGTQHDSAHGIAVDSSGNIYTTGRFRDTVDFDPGAGTANLTSNGGDSDIYVSKLDSSGSYVWAKSFGTTNCCEIGYGIGVDSSGNVYTIGTFMSTVDFDPGAGTANLTASDFLDAFVLKLDSSGNYVWAKSFTGTGNVYAASMAVDSSGNIYTTGYFTETADFDPGAGTANLTSNGGYDVFVSKLDSSGNYVWAKSFGSSGRGSDALDGTDYGLSVAVDSSGNVYTTGKFEYTADFDPGAGTANLTSSTNNGGNSCCLYSDDAFVLKLDSSGNYVWAKSFTGTGDMRGNSVAVDSSGNIYTTGYFTETADFDPGAGTANLTSNAGYDAFVSKLDSSGNYVWVKSFTGTGNTQGGPVAVDSSGNVYTAGKFEGTADFDPGAGTANLTSNGGDDAFGDDAFVSKLDSSGNYVWAKSFGGDKEETVTEMVVDSSGNVYTAGRFEGTADFDPGAGTLNLTSNGDDDAFVSKLDSSGDLAAAAYPGMTLSKTSGSVSEAGGTDSFTVVLDAQPSSDVVLSVESSDTGEATVAPATVTFTSGNWNTAQTITVAGVDDDLTDGNQTATVTVSVVDGSSADAFDPLADQTVAVTNADDDSFGLSVVQSDGSTGTTESGDTDSFTVTLNTQPASDVVVSVVSSDTGEVTVAPATVTFTSGNWNTAQTITVTGVDDDLVDGTQNATVTLSVVDASSDDDYDSVADAVVSVTNAETDSTVATTTTTTTTTAPSVSASVVLSVVAAGSDAFLSWVPSPAGGVQSYVLAWRGPSGNWSTHSTYDGGVLPEDTLFDLADGTHSFQILTSYTDGNSVLSNTESITVPTPLPGPTVNPELIAVGPFDCAAYPSLIQVIGTPGVGHSVKQLDLNTGEYSEIFSIPFNRTPSYTHLNGIGINPVDGALYGLMQVQGFGYLVRFDDAGNVAFVARVPAMSNAGDVDAQGRFMWDSERTNFYVLSGIAEMEGFADPGDAADKSKITPVVTGTDGVADVAALSVDLGAGERSYAMGVNGRNHKLQIWSYDNQPEAWIIDLFENGSPAQLTNGGFGAAWSHEDRIYFASNSGAGVYEIDIPSIDLNAKTADIRRVANSQATAINDGTTCIGIDVPPPGPTVNPELIEVGPFDCAAYPALIQIMGKTNSGMEVKQLDIAPASTPRSIPSRLIAPHRSPG